MTSLTLADRTVYFKHQEADTEGKKYLLLRVYIGGLGCGTLNAFAGAICKPSVSLLELSDQGCFVFRNCLAQAIRIYAI